MTLIIISILVSLGISLHNYWQSKRWKTINGYISYKGKNYKYSFSGKDNWQTIGESMGCNMAYDTAQTWGLVNHKVSSRKRDIAQIKITVSIFP